MSRIRRTPSVVAIGVVAFAAVGSLAVPVVSASASAADRPWFHDPVSRAQRRAEVAVPLHPARTIRTKVRHTIATYRTHGGKLAVPASWARGHTLGRGQAVVLQGRSFRYDHGAPSAGTRHAVRALTRSLTGVTRVRCEGYADFGGAPGGEGPLSRSRARAVCAIIARNTTGIATSSVGYGIFRPVVIGGRQRNRLDNRRVVVQVIRTATVSQPTATAPPAPVLTSAQNGFNQDDGLFATLTFTAPTSDGGSAITGYEYTDDDGYTWAPLTYTGTGPFTVKVSEASDCSGYLYMIRARNAVGEGPGSTEVSVISVCL